MILARKQQISTFEIKLIKTSMPSRCSAAVRDLPNNTFCARHAYSEKWRLQKWERAFILSAALSVKTKREVAQFNSHFDARGSPNASWEKRGRAKQKGEARHSTR